MLQYRQILFACVLLLLLSPLGSLLEASDHDAATRIGTYDMQQVFEALEVGQLLQQRMSALQAEAQRAQQAGDHARLQELQGEAQQIQQDVIEDFRTRIEDASPGIAEANDVHFIVAEVIYVGPEAEVIDLTTDLIAALAEE